MTLRKILLVLFLLLTFLLGSCIATQPGGEDTLADTTNPTEEESPMETETTPETEAATAEEVTTEEETTLPVAGMDSGIVRDGTPKKYFTIRFDDGITQDARVIEILKKYNMDCCTFYVNTGLLGASWDWVGPSQFPQNPHFPHQRYTKEELQSGIYDGFDVEVHTLTHPNFVQVSNDRQVTREVAKDAENIAEIFGYQPVGMAWPGGDNMWNDHHVDVVMKTTNIRYGSCTTRTGNFKLPEYFMKWRPTCSISEKGLMTVANRFIDAEPTEDMLFYVWCHGYELDGNQAWDTFENFIKLMSEAAAADDSIVPVTNAEFYQLFKDEIPSWK